MDDSETETPQAEVTEAPDFAFLDGLDGVKLNEVTLVFQANEHTKIGGVTFHPRKGVSGLNLQTDISRAHVREIVLTVDADGDFPGVTFQCDANMLLALHDKEWRAKVVAEVKAKWSEERSMAELANATPDPPESGFS